MSIDLIQLLRSAVSFVSNTLSGAPSSATSWETGLGPSDFSEFTAGLHDDNAVSAPSVNIDGTPMMGAVDINGNPYGVTQSLNDPNDISRIDDTSSGLDPFEHGTHSSDPFEHNIQGSDPFEHLVNIDGTPMCGDTDIHGNPYGVTDFHSDSWDVGMSSSWD